MSIVYWDTMLFVYWLEENPAYIGRLNLILTRMAARHDELCTSTFTLGEVLVGPKKKGDAEMARRIRTVMRGAGVKLLPFTAEAAERFADIRATHGIKPADAIHLAAASSTGVDLFLTNDQQLARRIVPGIKFIADLDVDLF